MKLKAMMGKSRWISSLIFLVALFLIVGSINSSFLTAESIISCLNNSVVYMLLAVGIAFVILCGEIDVSIGATMGLAAAMVGTMAQHNQGLGVMIIYALALGLAVGLFNGLGVAVLGIPSLIFTLGTCGILRGIVYLYSGGRTVENFAGSFTSLNNTTVFSGITWFFALTFAIVIVVYIILTYTKRGKYFIAVGDNINGAILVGLPAKQTKIVAYIISSCFAAFAGIIFASKYGQVNIVAGTGYEMSAIAACVIGGISLTGGLGDAIGAMIGAVIMSSIAKILVFLGLSSDFNNTITGVMLITIVVVDALTQRRAVESSRRKRLAARSSPGVSSQPLSEEVAR
ncbi:MAG: ABC transporter permease [Oscillospiraceae bacterium]